MLILNEDLFEPIPDIELNDDIEVQNLDTPEVGEATGIANIIHDLIIDENEAIQGYNNAIANMEGYPELIAIMKDIAAEEQLHMGQLEQALIKVSPNAVNIMNGAIEAENQLNDELKEAFTPDVDKLSEIAYGADMDYDELLSDLDDRGAGEAIKSTINDYISYTD